MSYVVFSQDSLFYSRAQLYTNHATTARASFAVGNIPRILYKDLLFSICVGAVVQVGGPSWTFVEARYSSNVKVFPILSNVPKDVLAKRVILVPLWPNWPSGSTGMSPKRAISIAIPVCQSK